MPFCPSGMASSLPPRVAAGFGLGPVTGPWERILSFVLAVVLVLWRSPAPDRLLEAHVPMFTRKHSILLRMGTPERVCCLGFPALPVTPALVGMPAAWSSLASPNPSRRWGVRPPCWYGNHFISNIGEEPDLPVSGYCGALAPDPARSAEPGAWGGLGPVAWSGQAHWVAHTGVGASAQVPRLQGGGGSWELYK